MDELRRVQPLIRQLDVRFLSLASVAAGLAAWLVSFASGKLLSADGSNYLLQMLNGKDYFLMGWQRYHAQYSTQWLMVLGTRILDAPLWVYYWLYAAGIIAIGLASLAVTCLLLRDRPDLFLPAVFSLLIFQVNSDYVIMGEHVVLVFSVWPLLAYCLAPSNNPVLLAAFLLFAYLSISTYETSALLMVLVSALCLWRIRTMSAGPAVLILAVGAAMALCSVWVGVHGVLFPRDPTNKGAFLEQIMTAFRSPLVVACLVAIAGLLAPLLIRVKNIDLLLVAGAGLILATCAGLGIGITPEQSFSARTLTITVLPLLMAITLVLFETKIRIRREAVAACCLFFCVALGYSSWNQLKWTSALGSLTAQLGSSSGFVPWDMLEADRSEFFSPWSLPSVSVLLQPSCVTSIVEAPEGSWQPFDPHVQRPAEQFVDYAAGVGGGGCEHQLDSIRPTSGRTRSQTSVQTSVVPG